MMIQVNQINTIKSLSYSEACVVFYDAVAVNSLSSQKILIMRPYQLSLLFRLSPMDSKSKTRPPLRSGWSSFNIAGVAALRSPDRNHRNTDRLRTGMLIDFAGIRRQPCVANQSLLSRGTALEMAAPTGTGPFAIGFVIEKRGGG
jgi:hypothetical protein